MGFFGAWLFDGRQWAAVDLADVPAVDGPSLLVAIHDSDLAFVSYAPAGSGSGTAFLGYTPRVYFEGDAASPPTDAVREARALAAWSRAAGRAKPIWGDAEEHAQWLLRYLATDDVLTPEQLDDRGVEEDDVFVEIKLAKFLGTLGVPIPEDVLYPDDDG